MTHCWFIRISFNRSTGEALAEVQELGLPCNSSRINQTMSIARSSTSVSETGKTPGRRG
jgi:hypothetical protein